MTQRTVMFDLFRLDPEEDSNPRRQEYEVELLPNMSVLDGLRQIQEKRDSFLAFRASCNSATCGSCAMEINGRIRLACETPVAALRGNVVRVDPLPNLAVVKDLVVDMAPFWAKYEHIRPWLSPGVERVDGEHPQSREDRAEIDNYVACVLCGACYAACPAVRRTPWYLGPAALAKAYRFISDSREIDAAERLRALNSYAGVWGCDTTFRCVRVCPKHVPPTHAVTAMRTGLVRHAAKRLMGWFRIRRKQCVG
jgi:succinate dehydrogenase / fumarate reductase iron-sulfur subunit